MNEKASASDRDWLGHAVALRRLAWALTGDEHGADDLVQETWLRARRAEAGASRPWLVTVLRNLVRDRARRQARETPARGAASFATALPDEAQVLERLEVAQRLAAEVARLDEPFRSAIHLRYFEQRSPEEIARTLGVPRGTVHTRLRRGLARLRERFTHEGEARDWLPALAALGGRSTATAMVTKTALRAGGVLLMTHKAWLGVVAALALLGMLALERGRDGRRPEPAHAAAPTRDLARAAVPATPFVPAGRPSAPPGSPEGREPVGAPADPDPGQVLVRGRVVVLDGQGHEHRDPSGILTLAVGTHERDTAFHEVDVQGGHWEVALDQGLLLVPVRLVAAGREVALDEPLPVSVGPDEILVRGRWMLEGNLRVIDAASGLELSSVELRRGSGWRAQPRWSHPGSDPRVGTLAAGVPSPVPLPEGHWIVPYWVHVPGYAWSRVDFDHRVGGVRTVALDPRPASIEVRVQGAVPPDAVVRLYPATPPEPDARGIVEWAPPDEAPSWIAAAVVPVEIGHVVHLRDFQAGRYRAFVETGEYEDQLKLAGAAVEVERGETAGLVLVVDSAAPEPERAPLVGTLRIPEGLDLRTTRLRLERLERGQETLFLPLGEMEALDEDERFLSWSAGAVRPGEYLLVVEPYQHRQLVAHAGPGTTAVDLEVPPLARVRVAVVEAVTGRPIVPRRLMWADGALEGSSTNSLSPLLPVDGGHGFTAPYGPVSIGVWAEGYLPIDRELELAQPEVNLRLEMRRATAVRLDLRIDGEPAELDSGWWSRVRVLDEEGNPEGLRIDEVTRAGVLLLLDAPGRHEVRLPAREGFLDVEPLVLDLVEGQTRSLTVELRRAR